MSSPALLASPTDRGSAIRSVPARWLRVLATGLGRRLAAHGAPSRLRLALFGGSGRPRARCREDHQAGERRDDDPSGAPLWSADRQAAADEEHAPNAERAGSGRRPLPGRSVRDSRQRAIGTQSASLGHGPSISEPGMTEFALGPDVVLGLMPGAGIARLLGVPDPAESELVPKAELYLRVDRIDEYHARALAAGARELSSSAARDWGRHSCLTARIPTGTSWPSRRPQDASRIHEQECSAARRLSLYDCLLRCGGRPLLPTPMRSSRSRHHPNGAGTCPNCAAARAVSGGA